MEKSQISNLVLGSFIFATVWALSSLGEGRIDVYVSMFALEYFVCLAVFRPRRRCFDFPAALLFGAFALIVSLRVIEILYR
uniref:Uncharacterized protein n=1 Tax=Candidatus Methanomethylicus mesodigestus TaxID=1867258 RepID=A0A7C3ETB1_9CREN